MIAQRYLTRQRHTAGTRGCLKTSRRRMLCLRQSARTDIGAVDDVSRLVSWLEREKGVQYINVSLETQRSTSDIEYRLQQSVETQQVVLEFPSHLSITGIDAEQHPEIQSIVKGRSELVQLTLWLMTEQAKGEASPWHPFLISLPERTLSPVLWSTEELNAYCFGSSIVDEAILRRKALLKEWDDIVMSASNRLPRGFSERGFLDAFTVVMAHAHYLPEAGRFALLPPLIGFERTGDASGCLLTYNTERDTVAVTSQAACRSGDAVRLFDGRSNMEMLLATGCLESDNPSDALALEFELVPADRLHSAKRQILESLGYGIKESFPIYRERIPGQLLSFLRLSRVQDPNQLTQVSFEEDKMISDMNEYEVLQLVLGECRVRLGRYQDTAEADLKTLQIIDLDDKQRLATELHLGEKQILQSCVDIVRRRLAPIRGIPAKDGKLEDPNKDIMDMFEAIESIPQAPKKWMDGFVSWAKGDYDPEWKRK